MYIGWRKWIIKMKSISVMTISASADLSIRRDEEGVTSPSDFLNKYKGLEDPKSYLWKKKLKGMSKSDEWNFTKMAETYENEKNIYTKKIQIKMVRMLKNCSYKNGIFIKNCQNNKKFKNSPFEGISIYE